MRKFIDIINPNILLLLGIFVLAIIVRFAYFPKNVYFSYDQARDFFFAGDILKGDIRLIGPPSAASEILFPGPLSLYIYSFIQYLFGKNPEVYSIFFRLYNALGVIPVFLIGSSLFDKKVGFLSAGLYAISYEQSQYALLMSHQPLAVLSVLLFYMGLTMLLFQRKTKGLVLAVFGLGLSIQFHYVYVFLIPIFLVVLLLLREQIPKLKLNILFNSIFIFFLMLSTYIISELKFKSGLFSVMFSTSKNSHLYLNEALYAINRFIHDSFFSNYEYTKYILILILIIFLYLILKPKLREKGIFLFLWFIGGILPYLISGTKGYYYSAAGSVSLLMIFSYLVTRVIKKTLIIGTALYLLVIFNNYLLIRYQNPKGPNFEIVIQPGMLLYQEEKALDYIYQSGGKLPFSVKALSIPLNINTTWSYLFEWYGKEKYGTLPVWSEKPAEGFPGNLSYSISRSVLPKTQFVIIEPLVGVREGDIERFFQEESYFTKVIEEKEFGTIVVQKREKI